jgi:hypothetical protein
LRTTFLLLDLKFSVDIAMPSAIVAGLIDIDAIGKYRFFDFKQEKSIKITDMKKS